MSGRRLPILLLVGCCLAAAAGQSPARNVIAGSRRPGDELLVREFVEAPSRLLRRANHRFSFHGDEATLVSQVRLLDQNKHGHGAAATLSKGGPDFNYVVVDFASARGHSVDFIVEIYGTKGRTSEWLRSDADGRPE